MTTEFHAKVDEMLEEIYLEVGGECHRLYMSGAVDRETAGDDYLIPRAVVRVALENMAAKYCENNKEVKNLRRF